jgi:hypothetical protein
MKCLSESDTSAAFGSKKKKIQILVAGIIDFGTQSHFGPKRTPGMDSAHKASFVMPQPIWASDQYLRSLSGGWALVLFHETEAIFGGAGAIGYSTQCTYLHNTSYYIYVYISSCVFAYICRRSRCTFPLAYTSMAYPYRLSVSMKVKFQREPCCCITYEPQMAVVTPVVATKLLRH